MIRTSYVGELLQHKGENVTIAGWVENVKELPNLRFIILRDRTGVAQITVHKKNSPPEMISESEKLNLQDVISVMGTVPEKQIAKIGPELTPQSITVLNKSEVPLPIDITGASDTELDKRLDWRVLDLRNPRNAAIFKIESKVIEGMEEWLRSQGFIQVATPAILGGSSEGGSEVFKLDYYGSPAFLRQDPQLHRQLAIAGGLDKIYDLGPNWRAEISHTPNHLSEHRACAVELGFISDETDTERVEDSMMAHAIGKVVEECKAELELVGAKVEKPSAPFPELRFPEIYDILKEYGKAIPFEEGLNRESEQVLARHVKEKTGHDFFFVNRFPFKEKPFYVMRVDEEPTWARSVDMIYRGLEVSSGGQREHRHGKLMEQVRLKGMNEQEIAWFTDNFKYGVPPHGGFAVGIERTVKQMLGIENVREVSLFPRTPERLKP
ncbi:MAG TPA: aspartate--tRNA(Asn) ligase [Nitrososphaerales archaeon]|nr:aspartate--tRNA(Asn) ligase [Nitrososphaerales archaeon]